VTVPGGGVVDTQSQVCPGAHIGTSALSLDSNSADSVGFFP